MLTFTGACQLSDNKWILLLKFVFGHETKVTVLKRNSYIIFDVTRISLITPKRMQLLSFRNSASNERCLPKKFFKSSSTKYCTVVLSTIQSVNCNHIMVVILSLMTENSTAEQAMPPSRCIQWICGVKSTMYRGQMCHHIVIPLTTMWPVALTVLQRSSNGQLAKSNKFPVDTYYSSQVFTRSVMCEILRRAQAAERDACTQSTQQIARRAKKWLLNKSERGISSHLLLLRLHG